MNRISTKPTVDYDKDDELQEVFVQGVRLALEKKRLKNLPISRYDRDKKCTYLEYPDGTRKYENG